MERELKDDCFLSTYKALLDIGAFEGANSPQGLRANMYKQGRHVLRHDDYFRLFTYHMAQLKKQMALPNPNVGSESTSDPNIPSKYCEQ